MNYLNKLKNILSNKKFNYIILLTTICLLNGHNIYASSNEPTEPDTLKNLYIVYACFYSENMKTFRSVSEEYAATLLNKNQDSIKNAFHQHPNINFRATSCIDRCCRSKSFADSFVLAPDNEKIYLKDLVEQTFFTYNSPTLKVLYGTDSNDFIRYLQNILFVCFDKNLSELTSSLKQYYKTNKDNYKDHIVNITEETFSDENIRKMLLLGQMLLQSKSDKKHNK